MGGDTELLGEIIDLFLDEYPKLLSRIKDAVTNNQPEILQASAHALKGSVGNFAASDATAAAFRLENIGKSGDMAEAGEALSVLEAELERVRVRLVKLKEEHAQ
jgi:HPt (histidine-containing phosphotransfer) domain-containing protein